jgi:hypothetical protein
MRNKKLSLATLAIGSILTLLGPAAASAQDRNNNRQRNERGYTESFNNRQTGFERNREQQRLEQQRPEQRRNWDRFHNSYSNRNSRRSFNDGYYDNAGRWCSYR